MKWFGNDWNNVKNFLQRNKLDGIELVMYDEGRLKDVPKNIVKGAHLLYWPMWIDFWKGNFEKVERILGSKENIIGYYGGLDPFVMVETYRKQFQWAERLGAEYVVMHINHIEPEHAFTFNYDYKDRDVIETAIEVINEAFRDYDSGIFLLFENVWSPGLTFLNKENMDFFLKGIQYKNKGFMLDLSHLIITNPELRCEEEAGEYILNTMDRLGSMKNDIKGVHMNKTLPREYLKRNHKHQAKEYMETNDAMKKYTLISNHLKAIDWHVPYDHESIIKIIEAIHPAYKVFEFSANSFEQFNQCVQKQNAAIQR